MVIDPADACDQDQAKRTGRQRPSMFRLPDRQPGDAQQHGHHDGDAAAARGGHGMAAALSGLVQQIPPQRITDRQPGTRYRHHEVQQHPGQEHRHQTTA